MGVCNCSLFCCTLLYVRSSVTIISMGKRELVALLNLSSWFLGMVEWLSLGVPWGCLRFVIVVFPDHAHLLFFMTVMGLEGRIPVFRGLRNNKGADQPSHPHILISTFIIRGKYYLLTCYKRNFDILASLYS